MNLPLVKDQQLYLELLEALSEGVILFREGGPILWCNRIAAHLLQTPREHLIGKSMEIYFPDRKFQTKKIILQESPEISVLIFTNIGQERDQVHFPPEEIPPTCNESMSQRRPKYTFEQLIGQNRQFSEVKELAQKAASSLSYVLIYGETGTGKELFAQSIHNASPRAAKPFVAVNCAAIPETLLEGILFGTIQGAFTGAVNRPGLFEQASEGTLFLDEINSMPLSLQAKLLRALQEGSIRRVGGVKDIPVNPRIISSSNVEPFEAIEKGLLRGDLFYRLGVVCLSVPPLRERKDDLPLLIDFFVNKIARKLNKQVKGIPAEVTAILQQYPWPGNVRQLEHAIECAVNLIEDGAEIELEHFPEYLRFVSAASPELISFAPQVSCLKTEMQKAERGKIIATLESTKGNITQAANMLGISRQSLYYRMKKYQININRY